MNPKPPDQEAQNKNHTEPSVEHPEHHKIVAADALLANRANTKIHHAFDQDLLYTSPSPEHYPHIYLWDSGFFTIMYAQTASYCQEVAAFYHSEQSNKDTAETFAQKAAQFRRAATEESFSIFSGQQENGFIPNIQHQDRHGRVKKFDLERTIAFDAKDRGSNYTQPPVLALGVADTYHAMRQANDPHAELYLQETYGPLKKFFDYFDTERSNSPSDKLIGIIHPHETGRDSDPIYDDINFVKKLRRTRSDPKEGPETDHWNRAVDYAGILLHGIQLRAAKGNVAEARGTFWANDVMMNCVYIDNLRVLSKLAGELGRADDQKHYEALASEVEAQILSKMWFPDAREGQGAFLTLNKDGQPIAEISISNLFPLTLAGLKPEQLKSVLTMMKQSFDTPYPLPSVATDSPSFDPHNREKDRLWRGPTWINTNWYLVVRGLHLQADRQDLPAELRDECQMWADKVAIKTNELLDKHGPREHYDPITGDAQRDRVQDFGWSWLGRFMDRPRKFGNNTDFPLEKAA